MNNGSFSQGEDVIKLFVSETPHFHRVILPETLQTREKLLIPKNFICKHGNLLSDKIFLKVPDGKTWQVELDKSNEHEDLVWMCRGWSDFVKYYSIGSKFFVVFGYEGNSMFNVMIFDTTMLEIDYYPRNSVGRNRNRPNNVDKANDDGHEFLSPEEDGDNGREKKISEPPRGCGTDTSGLKRKIHPHCSKHDLNGESGQFLNQTCKMNRMFCHPTTESSPRARAPEAASRFNFRSTFPFFKIVFSEVKMKGSLHLPNDFAKDNLEEKRTRWVTLKVLHGSHSWRVKMWCYVVDSDFKEARFTAGWSAFRTQVPLHHDDVCIFKLVNQKDMVFHVFVFRGDNLVQ